MYQSVCMVTLLLSISFYGNFTIEVESFLDIRLVITLLQELDDFNEGIEFNEDF